MTSREARNKLTHAILQLRCEADPPFWAHPGIILAVKKLSASQSTFFTNTSHRSTRCLRCAEIIAVSRLKNG